MTYQKKKMEETMKLQENINNLLQSKEPEYSNILIDYIADIEDNRVSNRNANDRLLDIIERVVIKEKRNDN